MLNGLQPCDLQAWLDWQERLHPAGMALGLERVARVATRMGVLHPARHVVTVAGTNGKGSCAAYLEAILLRAGHRVGCYTSPHLVRYNERVRVQGRAVADESLCRAFEQVETARDGEALTYFEFGTLAALRLFADRSLDVAVLEVGLGGRLDAVNVVDPDAAVITSIGLDHTRWLGEDLEAIGYEKAGILRPARIAVCGERHPPHSIARRARAIGARLYQRGRDFEAVETRHGWRWLGPHGEELDLPLPGPAGGMHMDNAATAVTALALLRERLPVTPRAMSLGLTAIDLPGRFQRLPGAVETLLDVAHNPQAAEALAAQLDAHPVCGRQHAVVAMLGDKDAEAVLAAMAGRIDSWFVAGLGDRRGRTAGDLVALLGRVAPGWPAHALEDPVSAYRCAHDHAEPGDRIVVFGSFYTVAAVLALGHNE